MTVQPARDQLEAELDSWMARAYEAEKRAWQAEKRITRLEAQTNIRGRAVVMYRERAREAEARIKAVRDVHSRSEQVRTVPRMYRENPDDQSGHHYCIECNDTWPCDTIRALDG